VEEESDEMKPMMIPHPKAVIFAENQPEYLPLPAVLDDDGRVTSRWGLTWRERLSLLLHGSIQVEVLTFNQPLQPIKLSVGWTRK
jgi:hypothetical protein